MSFSELNYISIVVGGIIHMVIGFLWYGVLFSKPWMKLVGLTKEKMEASKDNVNKSYLVTFALALVMAATIQLLVKLLGLIGVAEAVLFGFLLWISFAGNAQASNALFMQKPVKLFLIDSGYFLVSIVVLCVLYVFW